MEMVQVSYRSILEKRCSGSFFTILLFLLLFSFFYNLPVLKYSIKGDNELRLYDLIGPFLFYKYFLNFKLIHHQIRTVIFIRRFYYFLLYCSVSIFLTLFFSIIKDRIITFVQAFLYLYHMWVFFLGVLFLYFNLSTVKKYNRFIRFVIICIAGEMLLVILQNLGVIPFLWNQEYYNAYDGFLSGTLGPNKIVLGMFTLISLTLVVGLQFFKGKIIPKIWLYGTLILVLIAMLLSGSRTTYVGAIVFMAYFLFKNTKNFARLAVVGVAVSLTILILSPSIVDRINDVISSRVTYVIDSPDDVRDYEDFSGVYSELSTGRDKLHIKYVNYLLSNPAVIPFGKGFVNRMGVGNSAHNIYLSLINEVGLVGLILFLRWLFSYLMIVKRKLPSFQLALNGLVLGMLVTLYFGEHLYIYRPLFGILGFFLMVCVLLLIPHKFTK